MMDMMLPTWQDVFGIIVILFAVYGLMEWMQAWKNYFTDKDELQETYAELQEMERMILEGKVKDLAEKIAEDNKEVEECQ